jgi:hypothetical protein
MAVIEVSLFVVIYRDVNSVKLSGLGFVAQKMDDINVVERVP